VTASFNYSTDLFDAARIERMAGHWQALLEAICAEPQRCIGELGLLGSAEHQQLTHGWNPASQASSGLCAHQLLEHQASLRPDAVALIFDDQQMTYAELDRCSNQLAHRLRALGVGPDRLVAWLSSAAWAWPWRWLPSQGGWRLCAAGPGLPAGAPGLHGRGQQHRFVAGRRAFA
jgi:non-ribosomal peptide synthetase component F